MTAPTVEPATPDRWAARHPVRADTDGDFTVEQLLALDDTETVTQNQAAHVLRGNARERGPVNEDEAALNHFETSRLFEPLVADHLTDLTLEVGARWLDFAARWIELSESCGDLRYLNTACKLIGAVWVQYRRADEFASVTGDLAAIARMLDVATDRLLQRLARRVVLTEEPSSELDNPTSRVPRGDQVRIAVLAGAASRSAARLVTAATNAGVPITSFCWYTPPSAQRVVMSNYSTAWYPPATILDTAVPPTMPTTVPVAAATTWDEATEFLTGSDLILLVGMPIVPPSVLEVARLGVLNAHNGILPAFRGMDAVGWALLHNQPIVCTLHLARPKVDSGEVIATHPVPIAPTATLAARMKTTQLRLLLAGAAHVAATGVLPDATAQPAGGTQYYRLHPHLKRVLDASPYAHDLKRLVTEP